MLDAIRFDMRYAARGLVRDPIFSALCGYTDVFGIRVGRYRAFYSVEGRTLIVIILKIGHR